MKKLLAALVLLSALPLAAQVTHPPTGTLADLGTCDATREGFLRSVSNGDSATDCNPTGTGDDTVLCECVETTPSNYDWTTQETGAHTVDASGFGIIDAGVAATADIPNDTITVTDSISIVLTTTNDPEDLTAAFDYTNNAASDPAMAAGEMAFGGSITGPITGGSSSSICAEGSTADADETCMLFSDQGAGDTFLEYTSGANQVIIGRLVVDSLDQPSDDPALPVDTFMFTDNGASGGDSILMYEGTNDAFEFALVFPDATADWLVTLPSATTTLVGHDTTDTLTNKSIDAGQLTGTVVAARVGADHIAAISDIDAAIKTDDTDTKLVTTTAANPASNVCLEMDSTGTVVQAADTCANLGPGGSTAWDGIVDPSTGTDIAFAELAQTMDWTAGAATAAAIEPLAITYDYNPSATDSGTQDVLTIERIANVGDAIGQPEALLVLANNDATASDVVTAAIRIDAAAGSFTYVIDANDADLGDIIRTESGGLVSGADLDIIAAGGALADDDLSDDLPTALSNVTTITNTQFCVGNAGGGFDCTTAGALADDDVSDDPITGLSDVTAKTGTGTTAVFSVAPVFTGDPTAPSPPSSDNDTSLATSLFVTSGTTAFTNKTYDAGATGNAHAHENGTAPVVDVDGEISIDETDDQVIYQSGTADFVLAPETCVSAVVEELASTDDGFSIGMYADAVTVTQVGVHCDGTCASTLADIDLLDRAGNAMTHGAPTVSVTTGNTTFTAVTAANLLVAGEGIEFNVANTPTNDGLDTYTITYCYTVDRQ